MAPTMKTTIALALIAIAMATTWPSTAGAQSPGPVTVRVPREVYEQPVSLPERPEVKTVGEALEYLSILVNGQPCGTISFVDEAARNPDGDAIGQVRADDDGCNRPGATISFVGPHTPALAQTFVLERGREYVLASLVPEPPSTGPSPSAPDVGTGLDTGAEPHRLWLLMLAFGFAAGTWVLLKRRNS